MHARPSFYREVHKGIRSFMLDLVVKAGQLDWNDAVSVTAFSEEVEAVFALLGAHAQHEDEFVAPMLRKAAPEVATVLDSSHDDQEEELESMRAALQLIDTTAAGAPVAGHHFLLALSRFVGQSLVHMADEEEVAMTAILNAFDDAAIVETHERLVRSIAPDEMAASLRWMLPAMNDSERAGMLNGMRQSAPPPVFEFVRGLAAEVLSARQYETLEESLMEVSHA